MHRCLLAKLDFIARRQWLSVALIGCLAFSGSAAIGLLTGLPEPAIHDEFSYLLAADTFAHGRLTNPTHPMWGHFESFHIIQRPSYMSKYPPAQGLILAAGQVITGYPIVGVWLSFGLMCAAITWMLYAWVSPRWALLGGLLAIIHPQLGIAGYWAQSYWGGAVAATGGALLMGSLRRITRRPCFFYALLMGIASAILAHSRPYEGLLVSLPAAVILLTWMVGKHGPPLQLSLARIVLPLVALLALAATAIGYYNLRITGNLFRMPYQDYEERYARAPLFIWQPPRPEIPMNHQVMRDLANADLQYYSKQDLNLGIGIRILFALLWVFRSGDVLLISLIAMFPVMARWAVRNRWALFALGTYIVLFTGLSMETYVNMHYAAPVVAFNYFFIVKAMRLWLWRNRRVGRFALWCIPLLAMASLFWALHRSLKEQTPTDWHLQRARITEQLSKQIGDHLIVISYGPRHSPEREWVYNDADIDHAKIVLARSMDVAQNCKLLAYFKGRRIWSLEVDDDDSLHNPEPYPVSQCP
jgi:hypothetical protein